MLKLDKKTGKLDNKKDIIIINGLRYRKTGKPLTLKRLIKIKKELDKNEGIG